MGSTVSMFGKQHEADGCEAWVPHGPGSRVSVGLIVEGLDGWSCPYPPASAAEAWATHNPPICPQHDTNPKVPAARRSVGLAAVDQVGVVQRDVARLW